jgi:hypothetical protein
VCVSAPISPSTCVYFLLFIATLGLWTPSCYRPPTLRCSGFLGPSRACPVCYSLDQYAVREPAVAAHLPAVWVAYRGDGLAGRPGKVPGVVLLAAWVSGLESRPFNNSTQYRSSSLRMHAKSGLLAFSGLGRSPLLGVKQTSISGDLRSACSQKATSRPIRRAWIFGLPTATLFISGRNP